MISKDCATPQMLHETTSSTVNNNKKKKKKNNHDNVYDAVIVAQSQCESKYHSKTDINVSQGSVATHFGVVVPLLISLLQTDC